MGMLWKKAELQWRIDSHCQATLCVRNMLSCQVVPGFYMDVLQRVSNMSMEHIVYVFHIYIYMSKVLAYNMKK